MNKIILIFFLFTLSKSVFSDTTDIKYFPLQVGNIWVYDYYWYFVHDVVKREVVGSVNKNGHTYYKMRYQQPEPYPGISYSYLRVDSVTGSIRYYDSLYGCAWLFNEITGDSLRAGKLDSFYRSCDWNWKLSEDTVQYYFGQQRKNKMYNSIPPPPGWATNNCNYVYGLGIQTQGFYYQPGSTYYYMLKGCVIDGIVYGDTSMPIGIQNISSEIPDRYYLHQNYPNPFNPKTKIRFDLPQNVGLNYRIGRLEIYNSLGQIVETHSFVSQPGMYEYEFDGMNYPSGVYFYSLHTGNVLTDTKKMILIK